MLRRWWEEKYKVPWTHDAAQELTAFEMLVLFWEDYYTKNPIEAKRTASGEVFFSTGDPLIDKWEKEIAMGLEPDLQEGLPPEEREKEREALERLTQRRFQMQQADSALSGGFHEDYTQTLEDIPHIGSGVPGVSKGSL